MLKKGRCLVVLLCLLMGTGGLLGSETTYLLGDANGDAVVSVADAVNVLSYYHHDEPAPGCMLSANIRKENRISIADASYILSTINPVHYQELMMPQTGASADCQNSLSSFVLQDGGVAVSLGDASPSNGLVTVPVYVWGYTGSMLGWTFKISFPDELLGFGDFMAPTVDERLPGYKVASEQDESPGVVTISVIYMWQAPEPHHYPVQDGTKIADLVFNVKNTIKAPVGISFSPDFGGSELVFGSEATFPLTSNGRVLVGETVPEMPGDLTAVVNSGQVTLSWTNGQVYDELVVERNGEEIARLAGDAVSFTDSPPSGEHGYRVRGLADGLESAGAFALASSFTMSEPTNASVQVVDMTRVVTWDNGEAYDFVVIERNGEFIASLPGDTETFADDHAEHLLSVYYIYGESSAGRSIRVPAVPADIPLEASGNCVSDLRYHF